MGKGDKRLMNCLGCETIKEKKNLHKLVSTTFLAFHYYCSEKMVTIQVCYTFSEQPIWEPNMLSPYEN